MENDIITGIISKISILKNEKTLNEESTKNYLVLPFISFLGYETTSPYEVRYEYICDLHEKGNRRVDCAILDKRGNPYILVEVKPLGSSLLDHIGQLKLYFLSCFAKYALLTDGDKYIVFTRNQIDGEFLTKGPAFTFSLSSLNESDSEVLHLLSKENTHIPNDLPFQASQESSFTAFDFFRLDTPAESLIGIPTNEAYKQYLSFCSARQEEPICLITWSKMVKTAYNVKIVYKKLKGVKRRVFAHIKAK